ncbi:UreF-domain-containing protein [Zopfochytrium polystomum]|nr:UreF-domain-containing protein [Zopfochytrium polystomum]
MQGLPEEWSLLMLADSGLPTGGFVASSGLEAAIQTLHLSAGKYAGGKLEQFFASSIQAAALQCLPYISNTALEMDGENEAVSVLTGLDKSYDALLAGNIVSRRASRAQGNAYLALLDRGLPIKGERLEVVKLFRKTVRGERAPGHLPVAFGLAAFLMNIPLERSLNLFLFQHTRSLTSAAVRLNVVGPYRGQQILADLSSVCSRATRNYANRVSYSRSSQRHPRPRQSLDIIQGNHDRLYTRLFNS